MTRSKDQDSVALTPHSVISEHRQEILVRWLDAAQEGIPYAQNQSRAELADHLQEQFQVIIEALASQAGYVSRQDRENAPSALHGRERATINNWNVVKLVQEYVILRRVIVGYCRDSCPLDEPEISTITSVIEDAMLIAVTEFTRSLQRVQQKLMGTLIHDVRTPLGVANLYVDLLDMEDIEEDHRRQYNDIVKRNLARCLAMLEDLLDVAQVEAGQGLLMHFKGTDLNSAMRTVCEEEDQIYTQRIVADLEDHPVHGVFDEALIVRTVENLISNALKFGHPNSPVSLSLKDRGDYAELRVNNFGEPIPEEAAQRMFDFFVSSSAGIQNTKRGRGLGLALIKTVAANHGGEVIFESSTEGGTTFGMTLFKNHHQDGDEVSVLL